MWFCGRYAPGVVDDSYDAVLRPGHHDDSILSLQARLAGQDFLGVDLVGPSGPERQSTDFVNPSVDEHAAAVQVRPVAPPRGLERVLLLQLNQPELPQTALVNQFPGFLHRRQETVVLCHHQVNAG